MTDLNTDQPGGTVTVYRAAYGSIVMGLYTNPGAARTHCESVVRSETPTADNSVRVELRWYPETDDADSPEGLFVTVDGDEQDTGYTLTPLTVWDAFDPDADA